MIVLEFQDKPIDWILIDKSAVAASERGFNPQTFAADSIALREWDAAKQALIIEPGEF